MTVTRQQLDESIQAYADAYKSGNPNLIKLAAAPLSQILHSLPGSWESPDQTMKTTEQS